MPSPSPVLRTLIVDDEPPARELIAQLLRTEVNVQIVGECADGREAVEAIRTHAPDLVFLDIQMPGIDGFQVIETLGANTLPHFVFVTAYDAHAIRAFQVHALDYILKPFEYERLAVAVQRARQRLAEREESQYREQVLQLLQAQQQRAIGWDRIAVRDASRTLFLHPQEIDRAEAEGNYVRLHVGTQRHLLRETLQSLEQRLADAKFIRISRSTLVNLERIREWRPLFHGDGVVVLQDGERLTVTRAYRDRLDTLFNRLR